MHRQRYIPVILLVLAVLVLSVSCKINPTEPNVVATPVFDPAGGTYTTDQSVSISCATSGATIRYTIDGSEPTSSSTLYSEPIQISATTTVKARGYKDGWTRSHTASATYFLKVAIPVFDPPGGTFTTAKYVAISCATNGATIRFTTNGSEPDSTSMIYTNPVAIYYTTTLKARAFKDGINPSAKVSSNYIINLPAIQMVMVPGGTFTMGDTIDDGFGNMVELPTHSVSLNPFQIGKYEITQSEYAAIMGSIPLSESGVGDKYPVYRVSWYHAIKYCNLRSIAERLTPCYAINGSTDPADWGAVPENGDPTWDTATCDFYANGYRLPTEAEWEYAARGATNTPDFLYVGSNDINAVAWYGGNNSPHGSKPVGTKAPNGIGMHDMSGNLWEWCWDWYLSSYYGISPNDSPAGPAYGSSRVIRGGDWFNISEFCRVSRRYYHTPNYVTSQLGFRVCRSAFQF